MSLAVLGLGTAVPSTTVTRAQAESFARALCRSPERAARLPALYADVGITTRHLAFERQVIDDVMSGGTTSGSVFLPTGAPDDRGPTTAQRMEHYEQHAAPLALRAAGTALERSGVAPEAITHVVTCSCTGFYAPGVDVALIEGLGLPATTERTHLGFMGCHAALNALRVARAFVDADPSARVLVAAVELCVIHYHYGRNPQRILANSLFADGAGALVGVPAAAAPADAWRLEASGACLVPASRSAMTWSIGDHGFDMTLSKEVPELIARHLRPWLSRWLAAQGLAVEEVASWAVHPGGPRILTAVEEALDLGERATATSREVLDECGNMSSPTVLFVLDRLRERGAPRPCVALGFGPGLDAEAALFR